MSLVRTFDAERFDSVVQHPDVLPYVSLGLDELPSTAMLVEDPANVVLMNEYGGFMFRQTPSFSVTGSYAGRPSRRATLVAWIIVKSE